MNDEFFTKRISETKTEIFPLDRLLPLESIYVIFEQEYKKLEEKSVFFRDRRFQRLREGYFSMFVAIYLQDINGKVPYLVFPSKPSNDVYIAYRMNDYEEQVLKLKAHEFDIKEFTDYSSSFDKFVLEKIIPKIDIYNIVISTYRKIDANDIKPLIDYLQYKNLATEIWILGAPTEIKQDYNISNVTVINKNGIVYDKIINLTDWIDKNKQPIVFQDVIHFK